MGNVSIEQHKLLFQFFSLGDPYGSILGNYLIHTLLANTLVKLVWFGLLMKMHSPALAIPVISGNIVELRTISLPLTFESIVYSILSRFLLRSCNRKTLPSWFTRLLKEGTIHSILVHPLGPAFSNSIWKESSSQILVP